MKVLLPFLLLFSFAANAQTKEGHGMFCVMIKGRQIYEKIKHARVSDKVKHCTLSCATTLKCDALSSLNLGLIKELMDLFGPGNAEWEDLVADVRGIRLAVYRRATNYQECLESCQDYYVNYRQ